MKQEVYALCRYVRHYQAKNGYAPRCGEVMASQELLTELEKRGIIELVPAVDRGPKLFIRLTDNGLELATGDPRRSPTKRSKTNAPTPSDPTRAPGMLRRIRSSWTNEKWAAESLSML